MATFMQLFLPGGIPFAINIDQICSIRPKPDDVRYVTVTMSDGQQFELTPDQADRLKLQVNVELPSGS